jgi:hypothetical protein
MEKGFEREVLDRLTKIETKLDDYNTMKEKTDDAHNLSIQNERDIDEIKDKIKWLSRTIVGAIIAGIVGLIFALIQISPK